MITLYIKVIYTPLGGGRYRRVGARVRAHTTGAGAVRYRPTPVGRETKDFQADGKEKNMCSGNDWNAPTQGALTIGEGE